MHIGASQIQSPRDIIKSRHQHPVGMFLSQGLADTGYLIANALTSVFQRIDFYRILRDWRTISPNHFQRIQIGTQGHPPLLPQISNQFLDTIGRTARTVDGHLVRTHGTCPHEFLSQPLGNGGCALYLKFHQLILRTLQLFLGCEEISGIRPQSC